MQIGDTLRVSVDQFDGPIDLDVFVRTWPIVVQLLAHRVESEEMTVYPLDSEVAGAR